MAVGWKWSTYTYIRREESRTHTHVYRGDQQVISVLDKYLFPRLIPPWNYPSFKIPFRLYPYGRILGGGPAHILCVQVWISGSKEMSEYLQLAVNVVSCRLGKKYCFNLFFVRFQVTMVEISSCQVISRFTHEFDGPLTCTRLFRCSLIFSRTCPMPIFCWNYSSCGASSLS